MKKFLIIAVLALTMVSTVAMAEVSMDGEMAFLMRSFTNTTDWNSATTNAGDFQATYTRYRIGVNGKHEGVKARIQLDTDWDAWGDTVSTWNSTGTATATNGANPGFETRPSNVITAREAWLDLQLGLGTAHVKVGRQFLQLGNGWFLRSARYGSDAWLVGLPGKNTIAFVNIKMAENGTSLADDTDAYALLDVFKIDDKNTVGVNIARARDRRGAWAGGGAVELTLDNFEVHYSGVLGPVKLQAQIDVQSGEEKAASGAKTDLEGNQVVIQAQLPIDALTISATLASGSGDKAGSATKYEGFVNFLDADPRMTMVYEYSMITAAGAKSTGFSNTQAIMLGAGYKVNKQFAVNADVWMLTANEKVSLNGGALSDDLGTEMNLKVTWTPVDQVSWYVNYGLFQTGAAYKSAAGKADDVTAIQSVLSYKF